MLLTGKAREAFNRVPLEEAHDYSVLKKALLFTFHVTADTYRLRFRSARKSTTETFPQFVAKLFEMLKKWICLSGKEESFTDLCDLVVREQLLNSVTDDLALFVRERAPSSVHEAAELAERFAEARRAKKGTSNQASKSGSEFSGKGQSQSAKTETQQSFAGGGSDQKGNKFGCFHCGGAHLRRDCSLWKKSRSFQQKGQKATAMVSVTAGVVAGLQAPNAELGMNCVPVRIAGQMSSGLRDTGATTFMVSADLVPPGTTEVGMAQVVGIESSMSVTRPLVTLNVDTPFFTGWVKAIVLQNPTYPVVIGNRVDFEDGRSLLVSEMCKEEQCSAVRTRAMKRSSQQPPKETCVCTPFEQVTPEELLHLQKEDPSLKEYWRQIIGPQPPEKKSAYVVKKGLLYRQFRKGEEVFHQLVVPSTLRVTVLKMAHDMPMAGHQGCNRTRERVWQEFYWPGLCGDVRRYCRSCDTCQRTVPKGRVRKVFLGKVPLVTEPFRKVAVDIVGPIKPASEDKNRFILVMVDYATRYPEATPLRNIDTVTVAEALWTMFTRVGIPVELLSDRGAQFTSEMMTQVHKLLGIKGITTTPYHAQANGLVERFNATLKNMVKKLCMERPKD